MQNLNRGPCENGARIKELEAYAIDGFNHREICTVVGVVGELMWMDRYPRMARQVYRTRECGTGQVTECAS